MNQESRYNEAHVISLIAWRARQTSQKETAAFLGVSPQYLSDVLKRRRYLSETVAEKMGYRKVVRFERIGDE